MPRDDNQGNKRSRQGAPVSTEAAAKGGQNSRRRSSFGERIEGSQRTISSSGLGRGWHGDPEGHAEAGRKGGRSRSR